MKIIVNFLAALLLYGATASQCTAQETARVNIYFSNDMMGYLEPCG